MNQCFLFMAELITQQLKKQTCLSVDGSLGHFHHLVISSDVAVTVDGKPYLCFWVLGSSYLEVELPGPQAIPLYTS